MRKDQAAVLGKHDLGLWETFVSSRSAKLASAEPDVVTSELESFISSSKELFNRGLAFNALAKAHSQAFAKFVKHSLELRKKHGPDWDQILSYYEERDKGFRELFSAVGSQNPTLVGSVHDSLSADSDGLRNRNREFCKRLGALLAVRDLIQTSGPGAETYLAWIGELKKNSNEQSSRSVRSVKCPNCDSNEKVDADFAHPLCKQCGERLYPGALPEKKRKSPADVSGFWNIHKNIRDLFLFLVVPVLFIFVIELLYLLIVPH